MNQYRSLVKSWLQRELFKIHSWRRGVGFTPVDKIYRANGPEGTQWHLPSKNPSKFDHSTRYVNDNANDRFFNHVGDGETVLIVGAGTGEDSVPFANRVGDSGAVYSIEAEPRTFDCLRRNVELYGLNNVTAAHTGISDTGDGDLTFYRNKTNHYPQQFKRSGKSYTHPNYERVPVPITTLDRFCEEHGVGHIDLLSVTANGHELAALEGAGDTIERITQVMLPDGGEERERAAEFLRDSGFSLASKKQSFKGGTNFLLFQR